jgi:hypothetical protein
MYIIFFIFFNLITSSFATEVKTSIHLVDEGQNQNEKTLVFSSSDGRVYSVSSNKKILINDLKMLAISRQLVNLKMNDNDEIIDITYLPHEPKKIKSYQWNTFEPSNLKNLDEAKVLFEKMNPNTRRRSQCYNRAMVWTYDWNIKDQINSQKVFLFFTTKYIRRVNYKWWFHVTPFILVSGIEFAMDREFTRGPLHMQTWTNIFISSHVVCPSVAVYSDYRNNQLAHDCYLIKAPMFYWHPASLEDLENNGDIMSDWDLGEVSIARRQAF